MFAYADKRGTAEAVQRSIRLNEQQKNKHTGVTGVQSRKSRRG